MVSQRRGRVSGPRPSRSRASTIPHTSTKASATNISERLVLNPSTTEGKLSLKSVQLKKVSKNWSTARPGPPSAFDDLHGRLLGKVLLEQLVDEPLGLELPDDGVERLQAGRAPGEDG